MIPDGTAFYLRGSRVSALITTAWFCGDGRLYVRVAGIRSFSIGDEILNFDKVIPDSSKIYIKYIFDEYIQYVCDDGVSGGYYKYKQHIYYDTLEWHTFKHVGIVIISDLNVKKKQYYIHYELEAPWVQPIKYKKEYGNPRRFYKKIFKGVYPVHYKARDGKRLKGRVSSIFR